MPSNPIYDFVLWAVPRFQRAGAVQQPRLQAGWHETDFRQMARDGAAHSATMTTSAPGGHAETAEAMA
jgi:hypothetical protein